MVTQPQSIVSHNSTLLRNITTSGYGVWAIIDADFYTTADTMSDIQTIPSLCSSL